MQISRLAPLLALLSATARFGLVTLARRTEHPGVAIVRELMDRHLV